MQAWNLIAVAAAVFLAASGLSSSAGLASDTAQPVTFHFYGAEDCPPCMAFKNQHAKTVSARARELGFELRVNVTERTRDVAKAGTFGPEDAILRRAGQSLNRVYPPVFFLSRGGKVLSVHGHDWRAALKAAEAEAKAQARRS